MRAWPIRQGTRQVPKEPSLPTPKQLSLNNVRASAIASSPSLSSPFVAGSLFLWEKSPSPPSIRGVSKFIRVFSWNFSRARWVLSESPSVSWIPASGVPDLVRPSGDSTGLTPTTTGSGHVHRQSWANQAIWLPF